MAASRRERKVVTILFCDLVGFTSQAETLDPEDVEAILRPYHARVRAELERHGGTVEKFIGDAVMAIFGAPVAHEDDPERAVRAALAIRHFAIEEGLELRVGITTGETLVRLDAQPEAGEGMASGDVVNTAARLQAAAPINGVLVDEATYRSTRHAVDHRPREEIHAKGKSGPTAVWEAVDARARFGVDVTHHARSELVGRERELSFLRDAFERAVHERTPQLVTLVAVPGMGKSRLVYELSQLADAEQEFVTWRQGRCVAYGEGVAFWALAEVVKAQAGIDERDAEGEAAAKLGTAVDGVLDDASEARWVESHLGPLVGLEMDTGLGGDRRGEAFAAWRRYLEALAEHRPLVLVLEDLHWADDGLLDFVDELVDWLSGVPLLVVCTARPELLERRPGWGGGKLNASTLGLSPLTEAQTALLISQLLERSLLPAETQRVLLQRADGNPLYAEQFAELYLERGSTDDLTLPESLQGIVAARLDGLSPAEKAVLQDASVLGKVFWMGALGIETGDAAPLLHSLERKGFLTRQRRSSVEGEGEWAFSHMLLRDVAYGQIPRADRAAKHRAVAAWVESLGRDEDHAEMLAFHWRSALELSQAAGLPVEDLADRTRSALVSAGDRSFALNAYLPADRYYRAALALTPEGASVSPRMLLRRAEALFNLGDDEGIRAAEDARDQALVEGDTETAAEAEALLAELVWYRGEGSAVWPHVDRAIALVGEQPTPARGRVLAAVARRKVVAGELVDGRRLAEEALEIAEALGLGELTAHTLTTIGTARGLAGDRGGVEDLERAVAVAREVRSPLTAGALTNLAVVSEPFDGRRARELQREALREAERFGSESMARFSRGNLLVLTLWLGDWDECLEGADAFIAECEASPHYLEPSAREARGLLRLGRGLYRQAEADFARGLELDRDSPDPQARASSLVRTAYAWLLLDRRDEARALMTEALPTLREHPGAALWSLPQVALGLGIEQSVREIVARNPPSPTRDAILAYLGRDLEGAADLYADVGNLVDEAEARLLAAERLMGEGRRAEGEVQLERSLAFWRSVRATYWIERGEALLAGAQRDSA